MSRSLPKWLWRCKIMLFSYYKQHGKYHVRRYLLSSIFLFIHSYRNFGQVDFTGPGEFWRHQFCFHSLHTDWSPGTTLLRSAGKATTQSIWKTGQFQMIYIYICINDHEWSSKTCNYSCRKFTCDFGGFWALEPPGLLVVSLGHYLGLQYLGKLLPQYPCWEIQPHCISLVISWQATCSTQTHGHQNVVLLCQLLEVLSRKSFPVLVIGN